MKWRALFVILIGLLMIGATTEAVAERSNTAKSTSLDLGYARFRNEMKVFNGTLVALDNTDPSRYYVPINKLPLHLMGAMLAREIEKQYLDKGTVSEQKIRILITLAEIATRQRLTPNQREIIRKLILNDLKEDAFEKKFTIRLKLPTIKVLVSLQKCPRLFPRYINHG